MAASDPIFNTATNVANRRGISDPHSIAQTFTSKQPFAHYGGEKLWVTFINSVAKLAKHKVNNGYY
ncbi:hypothetical protein ACEZEZ_11925 [Kluyvera ascorbata]|jgi:hypothetical protein|uniref:Uncharacterized protein n=1 Tax=Kluyvera ascorbata TaxID=51288 RepID=A0AB35X5W1_9ENTR|nr:hypothetical protein KATP_32280 [Kluyvera ascorbata]HCL5622405.1 hypothetical protein [Kluyvera ascorbata]HED3202371.1 hypothetical protein [Kluyvera ascorbata]HED4088659.1 hypothetical protein [Kluyvera ascorbata]